MANYNNYADKKSRFRPCMVDGKQALFHRWIERDVVYYEYDPKQSLEVIDETYEMFTERHLIPRGNCTLRKVQEEAAIVEFKDGSVEIVSPDEIRFLDTAELFDLFYEYFGDFSNGD